jgi:mannitol/fructose-specific phosphotransferase system IIA component (Ntr-type)
LGRLRGKGENLWKSLYLVDGDIIVWVDSDIKNIHPKFVYGLVGPLLEEPEIGYVKAFYRRPIRVGHRLRAGGGRVTELLVRPFLNLLFPHLTMLAQPLAGEYAGRRTILERLSFFSGYPVEIGLLIDIERRFDIQSIAQVDMDVRVHRNQSIESLRRMSYAILSVLITRSEELGKIALLEGLGHQIHLIKKDGSTYLHDIEEVRGEERPPMITIKSYQRKRGIPADDLDVVESHRGPRTGVENVAYLFQEPLVQLELTAVNRDETLSELIELIRGRSLVSGPDVVLEQLKNREQQMSTAIGHGVAVPHVISQEVFEPVILLGRSKRGINFSSSIFRRPVHLVFMILAPPNRRDRYLEILSSLVKLLRHRKVIDSLLAAKSPAEAISVLKKHEALIRLHRELGV